MKKLTVCFLTVLLALFAFSVFAFPPLQYRWRFELDGEQCFDYGTYYPGAGSSFPLINNTGLGPITTSPGDGMLISIHPSCCGANPTSVGYKWQEVSQDGGKTWSLVSPTFVRFYVPSGVTAQFYQDDPNTGMQPSSVLSYCH